MGFRIITLNTSNELKSALVADSTGKKAQTNPWGIFYMALLASTIEALSFTLSCLVLVQIALFLRNDFKCTFIINV